MQLYKNFFYVFVVTCSVADASNVIDVSGQTFSRGNDGGLAYANFKADKFSYLNITSIGLDYVMDGIECGLACVNIPSCFSFNLAARQDIIGKMRGELLPSDMFNNSDKFVASQSDHHFGIMSPCSSWPCQNNGTRAAQYEKNSYVCVCGKGYTGKHCEIDVNEYDLGGHDCDSNANCVNAPGSYDCKCNEGFSGDGRTCTDIDECALQENNCTKVGANCTNTAGSFNCTCQTEYFWNGQSCESDGCYNYSTLRDATRKSSYVTLNYPVLCDDQLPVGWYRFEGAAGTKMPTTRVPQYRCGTQYSGWLDGTHPSVEDGEVVGNVCFSDRSTGCQYSNLISVKNCGSYYIYKLPNFKTCNLRYCGTD